MVLQLVAEGKIELDTPSRPTYPDSSAETGSTATTSPSANSSNTPADSPTTATTWKTKSDITTHANFSTSRSNILPTSPPERVGSTATPTTSLAGLLVQKITEKPLAEEMNRRIFAPIDLQHTYFPEPYDEKISELHPRGYYRESSDAPPVDITEIDPSWDGPQGIDLHHLGPQPVSPRTPRRTTAPRSPTRPDAQQPSPRRKPSDPMPATDLDWSAVPLPCGGLSWSHGGSFPGYETRGGATDDGREANIAVSMQVVDDATRRKLEHAVDIALCR